MDRRAGEHALAPDAARLLDELLDREAERVWRGLAAAAPRGPVCLLALSSGAMRPAVADAFALTAASRDDTLRHLGPRQGLEVLWSPYQWGVRDVVDEGELDDLIDDDELAVERALERDGCAEPELAVLHELAWRLSRAAEPPVAVSEDFACVVHDAYARGDDPFENEEERGQAALIASFRASARPEVVAAYAERGWLSTASEAPVLRASQLPLPADARERLAALVASEAGVVWRAVARAAGSTPLAAVGFIWADPGLPTATYVAALSAERLATIDRDDVWMPADWDHWDILDSGRADDTYARAEVVAADLDAAGAHEPEELFLHELAHAIAHGPVPDGVTVTGDFGAFAIEHERSDEGPATFRAASRPEAVAAWERRGLLP